MATFNGKWELTSSENMDGFLEACGVTAGNRATWLPKVDNIGGLVEEFVFDKSTMTAKRNVYVNGVLTREGKGVAVGTDFADKTLDGRDVTTRVDVKGPTTVVRTETGDGCTATYLMETAGDVMTVTLTCGAAKATRKYKKQ